MICPECGNGELVVIEDEVDIGVGTQKHVLGWECPKCGGQFMVCENCGALAPNHEAWCKAWKPELS